MAKDMNEQLKAAEKAHKDERKQRREVEAAVCWCARVDGLVTSLVVIFFSGPTKSSASQPHQAKTCYCPSEPVEMSAL